MIYDGKFVYGQIYSLNVITEELQMSRTPIRDAMLRLSNEGRIDLLPSRGFRLRTISDYDLKSRYHYANAIEGYAVYCLAQEQKDTGATPLSALKLQVLVQQMQSLDLDTVTFGEFTRLDNAFHLEIVGSIECANFAELSQIKQLGYINLPELHLTKNPLPFADILHCHEDILHAILSGDPHGAYDAMLRHAQVVYDSYKAAGESTDIEKSIQVRKTQER